MNRILSGSSLKMIAVITMAIDHIASHFLRYHEVFMTPLLTYHGKSLTYYFLLRAIGRLAFPLFAFLIVEGFQHTRNRWNYGRNLFIFALISEIPWLLVHGGTLRLLGHNVMFTLLLGFLGLCVLERYRTDVRKLTLYLLGMFVFSVIFRAEYDGSGFAFILLLYTLRQHRLLQAIIGSCMLPMKWVAGLAFIPINMYNGQRGFIRGTFAKYAFYAFYPLHLLLIYYLKY